MLSLFFFFNDTATTEIYTLSLHDALPILPDRIALQDTPLVIACWLCRPLRRVRWRSSAVRCCTPAVRRCQDRKSTRLNSSHQIISYAVFCLKKKKQTRTHTCEQVRLSDVY